MDSLVQFINNSQIQVPQDFTSRFIYNYEHKGEWWQSSKAYDEWFNQYYDRYQKFIQGVERELIEDVDYKTFGAPAGVAKKQKGGHNKKHYLISFEGLKQLELKNDKETRRYHIILETQIQQFIQIQQQKKEEEQKLMIEELKEEIQEQQEIIEHYEAMKKRGIIYEIYYKLDQNENYIGMHEGCDPKERFKTHVSNALASLKQPLYRRIFREGLKQFDIRTKKEVDYYHTDELMEEEEKMIDELNPSLNRNYIFECPCGREPLKQEHAIFQHRQECEEYQCKMTD